jgi:hypothetical protein
MKSIYIVVAMFLLSACATSSDTHITDAVADFIQVAELLPEESVRTRRGFNYTIVSRRYVVLKSHKDYYLVEFVRDCRELYEQDRVSPDYRYDTNVLRPRFDTIRGCRIAKLYTLDESQAQELESLGDAPGD